MLKEDQVVELLARCEGILGETLAQARGNLKHPESRAAAIWELIGIEEFARHHPITHEPEGSSRPDLLLNHHGNETAVELTFLYPQNWENERKRNQANLLIREVLEKESINLRHIRTYFEGKKSRNGYFQSLPDLHDKKWTKGNKELEEFINSIKTNPSIEIHVRLDPYDIDVHYEPQKHPWNFSSGHLVEGQSTNPSANAVYRKIREKHRQHKLEVPLFLCIGGDDSSPIASRFADGTTERNAIFEAFKKHPKVSGLSLSQLEWSLDPYNSKPIMQSKIFLNDFARHPVNSDFMTMLESINFNRWRYSFSLAKWDRNSMDERQDLDGHFQVREISNGRKIVAVPAQLILDALIGKRNILTEYRFGKEESPESLVGLGWEIEDVNLRQSNIEDGKDNFVELTLVPRRDRVFQHQRKF